MVGGIQKYSNALFLWFEALKKHLGCALCQAKDQSVTRIKWIDDETIEFIDPQSGQKTVVSRKSMWELNNFFATQAEGILDSLDVPPLTPEQLV